MFKYCFESLETFMQFVQLFGLGVVTCALSLQTS